MVQALGNAEYIENFGDGTGVLGSINPIKVKMAPWQVPPAVAAMPRFKNSPNQLPHVATSSIWLKTYCLIATRFCHSNFNIYLLIEMIKLWHFTAVFQPNKRPVNVFLCLQAACVRF